MGAVPATFFDGQTSKVHKVTLAIEGGRVAVSGDGVERSEPIGAVEITDEIGQTPRFVKFNGGAFCEVVDLLAFHRVLAEQGLHESVVSRWEHHRAWILAATVGFVVFLVLAYQYGVPAMAAVVADRLPMSALDQAGNSALRGLDTWVFKATDIPPERQVELVREFDKLRLPGEWNGRRPVIVFRKSEAIGANALTLPSGTVVVTDELIALAKDDRELLAVLAHEAGHIARRHTMRMLLQRSVVTLWVAWYVGDLSSVVAAAPTVVLEAKYSRDFEREADDFAAAALRQNAIDTRYLADILERLESSRGESAASGRTIRDYLSSHPATAERLMRLRGQ
jgi:Zn-dependent protease with chaperone function